MQNKAKVKVASTVKPKPKIKTYVAPKPNRGATVNRVAKNAAKTEKQVVSPDVKVAPKEAPKGGNIQSTEEAESQFLMKLDLQNFAEDNLPSRSGAFNQAKRDAGIPRTQHPEKIERVPMRSAEYEGSHVIKDSKGNVIMTREYHFTNNFGNKIIIQDHSAGHIKGGQGPHFNVRPANKPRTGKVEGTKEHYPFK